MMQDRETTVIEDIMNYSCSSKTANLAIQFVNFGYTIGCGLSIRYLVLDKSDDYILLESKLNNVPVPVYFDVSISHGHLKTFQLFKFTDDIDENHTLTKDQDHTIFERIFSKLRRKRLILNTFKSFDETEKWIRGK